MISTCMMKTIKRNHRGEQYPVLNNTGDKLYCIYETIVSEGDSLMVKCDEKNKLFFGYRFNSCSPFI